MKECATCKKSITSGHEIHQVNGEDYCSKECAVSALTDFYIMNAKDFAIEHYEEHVHIEQADVCKTCRKNLNKCETIYAMIGSLFCSKDCCIGHINASPDLRGPYARVMVESLAEEVNPREIGI